MPGTRSILVALAGLTLATTCLGATPVRTKDYYGPNGEKLPYTPVVTPNGTTLPWTMVKGVKEFRLTVDEIEQEFAPGMKVKCWGYNGRTPGPTIEAVEGDRVRIYVTNNLKENTAVHWHGVILPSGMDGVQGLSQKGIPPGETYAYEFTLRQHGTQMYHSHGDEMVQIGLGAMGFFIIHPKNPIQRIDRDFAIFLNEWAIPPGTERPDPNVMTDFDIFTFNSRVYPGTAPLVARKGDRVRIRLGNVGQESHPIHIHGHSFRVVATDGGDIPPSAQWPETTVVVAPGQTRDFEFIATSGDWALHCHRRHHPMNTMGHSIPNVLGVNQEGLEEKIQALLPNYMAMGENGMEEHIAHAAHMAGPENTLPMMAGEGPFGGIGMGGMFTVLKVRDELESYDEDPGWYDNPPGTVAGPAPTDTSGPGLAPAPTEHDAHGLQPPKGSAHVSESVSSERAVLYICPMHPEVVETRPGKCPKCGMTLVTKK